MRWSPPEQKAQPPSRGDGPLPVSSTQPTSGVCRAWSSTRYSSSTVCGRKALRTSGRSKAIRTAPVPTARWYVTSVRSSKPSTGRQAAGSKIAEGAGGSSGGVSGATGADPMRPPAATAAGGSSRLCGGRERTAEEFEDLLAGAPGLLTAVASVSSSEYVDPFGPPERFVGGCEHPFDGREVVRTGDGLDVGVPVGG